MTAFTTTTVPRLGKTMFRLGLACNMGLDAKGIATALTERPIQYIYWTPRMGKATAAIKRVLAANRDRYVVATGPTLGFWGGNVRRFTEKALRTLGTDHLDILQLHWLGITSAWTDGTVDELVALRDEGKVRALGVSIHDRPRAGQLAADSPLDMLMIRYNAAHPGAERDIFPKLPDGDGKQPPKMITAYTATRWRKLLRAPRGWKGPVMTAGDCYRFCLSDPHVNVVLTGPKTLAQLDENLAALEKGPLDTQEMAWVREFGAVVHG